MTGIKHINESYSSFEIKPTFDVTDSYISITLSVKKDIELSNNEEIVFQVISNNREYTRIELENLTGLKKDTLIRTLNSLISKSLVLNSGSAAYPQKYAALVKKTFFDFTISICLSIFHCMYFLILAFRLSRYCISKDDSFNQRKDIRIDAIGWMRCIKS